MIVDRLLHFNGFSHQKGNYLCFHSSRVLGSGPDGDAVCLHRRAARGQSEYWGPPDQHPQAGQMPHIATLTFLVPCIHC